MRYILRRKGAFHVLINGLAHCSKEQRETILQYNLTIECNKLDKQKFVFEQDDLGKFFEDIGTTSLSCEALAGVCASTLQGQVSEAIGSVFVRVTVEISPPPYVGSATAVIGRTK